MATWEQTYPLSPGGGVQIEQRSGRVQVLGWDQPQVKVTATSRSDEDIAERLEVHAHHNGIHIRVKARIGIFLFDLGNIDLQIMVPVGASCSVESGSGPIEVRGTLAPLQAETGSGRIEVLGVAHASLEAGSGAIRAEKVNGAVEVETGSGAIEVIEINGSATVETGSGHVVARKIKGALKVETGSGHLEVAEVFGRVELETGSGGAAISQVKGDYLGFDTGGGAARLSGIDVSHLEVDASSGRVELELAAVYPGGNYSIDTGSGSVAVTIPVNAGLEVRADTSSGRVNHEGLPFQSVVADRGQFRGVLNGGGAILVIDAGSGGVQLRPGQPAGARPSAPVTASVAAVPPAPVAPAALPAAPCVPPVPPVHQALGAAVKDDPALEHSEQLRRIVAMVEAGKLTPDEAEALLRALDDEEETAQ